MEAENEKEVWERLTAVEISTHTLRGERDLTPLSIGMMKT